MSYEIRPIDEASALAILAWRYEPPDIGYGFGWQVETFRGMQIMSHNGAWSGFSATVARCPERRFTVILLSNLDALEVSDYTEKIAEIYRVGESQ